MHATIELKNGTVLAHFLDKVIKDERIFIRGSLRARRMER